jgi:hypothetical protein
MPQARHSGYCWHRSPRSTWPRRRCSRLAPRISKT